jgi:hypothetical protein
MEAQMHILVATEKRRTITLTNRAPIRIVEDDWPVIAQGTYDNDVPSGSPYVEGSIDIRVRQHRDGRIIIHAKYNYKDQVDEKNSQMVRVGRYLDDPDDQGLWDNIIAVGEELHVRILNEHMREFVVRAVDACFAQLPAVEMPADLKPDDTR